MLNCCANSERQDERNLERSKAIDRLLRVDERKKASEVKLLLLGQSIIFISRNCISNENQVPRLVENQHC